MPENVPCDYCRSPTKFATELQPLGSEPGYRVYFCEACKRYTWTKWRISQQQQPSL
jgi:hypothetical protein